MHKLMICGCCLMAAACGGPPPAPTDYESLLGYLFMYADEGGANVADGVARLDALLDEGDLGARSEAGFGIRNLSPEAVLGLDARERKTDRLNGVAITTRSHHNADLLAQATTWSDFGKVIEGTVDLYERSFTPEDSRCFWTRACPLLEAQGHVIAKWGGVLWMETRYSIQYRWLQVDGQWVWLMRQWLNEEAPGECCDVIMRDQYYVGINIPDEQGTRRIHARWFDINTGIFGAMTGDSGKRAIEGIAADAHLLDAWLDDHADEVK